VEKGIRVVEEFIGRVRGLNVLIAGETICDEFIKVSYQGQSMKSFCPVFQLGEEAPQRQMGGSAAIYRHLKPFVKSIDLISNSPDEIVKTRYIDANDGTKHIELNRFNLKSNEARKIDTRKYDAVIIADFGHGFCDSLEVSDGFHLMCQTNSHNFGFNRISKWKANRKRSVCIDLREASLQINRRISDCSDAVMKELYNYELFTDELFITVGKEGSVSFDGKEISRFGSFPTEIVDTIGAGDAYFAFSSVASAANLPSYQKMVIPSLAASLTTTWLCNEKSVEPGMLIEHAAKYL
jgi:bifunctional ADP-heptose synthase (sugar kinase/adenylyltransferase)